jgi:hypothetical protein
MNPYRKLLLDLLDEQRRTVEAVGGPYESCAAACYRKWTARLRAVDAAVATPGSLSPLDQNR